MAAEPSLDLAPSDCSDMPPLATGGSTLGVAPFAGVTQPFAAGVRVAACSLSIANLPTYTSAMLTMLHLDAAGLAPDPTTVALRTRAFTSSSLAYGRTRADFWPPVVTASLPHAAEVSTGVVAMDWKVTDPYNGQNIRYDGGAPASPPPACW